MVEELISKLEENSVKILDECLQEIKAAAGPEVQKVPDEELRVSLYMLLLQVIEFLRRATGAGPARVGDFRQVFIDGMKIVVDAIDNQSSFTAGHSAAVARHAGILAARMSLSDREISDVENAARIHNLGLINSSQRALTLSRTLNEDELQQARNHCVLGAEILRPIEFLAPMVPMVRYHHTRYDGSGYPGGTGGQNLPLGARIIAVADAYQAMISPRPHRPAMTREQALAEIDKGAGKQFDPKLAGLAHEIA